VLPSATLADKAAAQMAPNQIPAVHAYASLLLCPFQRSSTDHNSCTHLMELADAVRRMSSSMLCRALSLALLLRPAGGTRPQTSQAHE
jgi:hypothetical protein